MQSIEHSGCFPVNISNFFAVLHGFENVLEVAAHKSNIWFLKVLYFQLADCIDKEKDIYFEPVLFDISN